MLVGAYAGKAITPNQVYDHMPATNGDPLIGHGALEETLRFYGVQTTWRIGMERGTLYNSLSERRPGILLIEYAAMVDAGLTERSDYKGWHYVMAVGMDLESVLVHDPYGVNSGAYVPVPLAVFEAGWLKPTGAMIQPLYPMGGAGRMPTGALYRARVMASSINVRAGPPNKAGVLAVWVGYRRQGDIVNVYEETPGDEYQKKWLRIGPGEWLKKWTSTGGGKWAPLVERIE